MWIQKVQAFGYIVYKVGHKTLLIFHSATISGEL